jgi:enoyl-CoA hydratase
MGRNWKTLRLAVEKGVGYLTLDNGGRFNTLHRACIVELKASLALCEANPEVVCIVLSGGEGESFAVGANIAEMKDFGPLDGLHFSELGQSLFERMEESIKPIIGALNGITMGGGCDLALSCDMRLASDRLTIAHPGAKLGIITGFCGTQKLPRLIGRAQALEVFMTSEAYGAAESLRMGLVDRVFPHETFWPEVKKVARRIAGMHPAALSYGKKLINASADVDLKNGQIMELGAFSTLFSSGDARKRATDFFARDGRAISR